MTFWNTYIKVYNCHMEEINKNYSEKANNLAKQPVNKKIST